MISYRLYNLQLDKDLDEWSKEEYSNYYEQVHTFALFNENISDIYNWYNLHPMEMSNICDKCVVVECDNLKIAFMVINYFEKENKKVLGINPIVVNPKYINKGYGKSILSDLSSKRGNVLDLTTDCIYAGIDDNNLICKNVFETLGFKNTGSTKDKDFLYYEYHFTDNSSNKGLKITAENITLRDYQLSDVLDEVRWTTTETEWFLYDTPWMDIEPVNEEELRVQMEKIINNMPENAIRWRFEIEVDGRHIGLVSSYYLDENFEYTSWDSIDQSKNAIENNSIRGLGIEICEMEYWGKGLGMKVLMMLMDYYRSFGENHFLIETWSGNHRMLGLAKKLGFTEVKRIKHAHNINGIFYDDIVLEKKF